MAGTNWITAGEAWWPEMLGGWRGIAAGQGLRPELDDRRWIKGDGSSETDDNQSPFLYEATKLQSSADMHVYDVPVAWLDAEHYFEHYSEIPNHAPTCPSSNAEYNPESDPKLQLQCRYHTSLTRLIFGGATIFKEGDDNAGIATILTTYNYHSGNAGTKHRERIHQ